MNNYVAVLKRVGTVLIVLGAVDVAYFTYCIATGKSYSSGFNVFAILAGIFLWRGNLATARLVTWLAAFFLVLAIASVPVYLSIMPRDLVWLQFRLQFRFQPGDTLTSFVIAALIIALSVWVYLQLRSPVVIQARADAGKSTSAPVSALVAAMALSSVMFFFLHALFGGESGKMAMELVRAQYGDQYRYAVQSVSTKKSFDTNESSVTAVVFVYDDKEISTVNVNWTE
ncbi:glucan phosphoethanolaminetransferase (alkaline phosphatase superfamily) [Luteibacter sp. Sphag1AF]|uniref:hypothetical protein n=1 Tax=Luteibacter sp. Sphag1AF TaxID=2587031 RepID=UPI00161DE4A5|nr:hypothetical protein [Luteibacter sp. Sphag1AF]MBB3225930.1 glucan phosphoethanolaminetransferase (alkaline phosphatase superfamily) [Luteibacter sp. Sphag1AF]